MSGSGPPRDEWQDVDADLRAALQHQKAALEQRDETERELRVLLEKAERLLAQIAAATEADPTPGDLSSADPGSGAGPAPSEDAGSSPE